MTAVDQIPIIESKRAPVPGTRIRAVLPIAVPMLLAVFTTFFLIGRESLWVDEGHSVKFAGGSFGEMWDHMLAGEANMALYYVFLHLWMKLGDSEALLRSLSAVFAILAVPVVFAIARRVAGVRAAFAAAMLLAANFFFIHSAQEARAYPLALLLAAISTLALLRALEDPSRRNWSLYVIAAALAVHAHVFCSLVLFAQGIAVMVFPGHPGLRRPMLISGLLTGVLLIPLALLLYTGQHGNLDWVQEPGLSTLVAFSVHLAGSPLLLVAHTLAIVALLVGPVLFPGRVPRDCIPGASNLPLLVSWLLVPVLVTFLFSMVKPVFEDRFLFTGLPALVILTGIALSLIRNRTAYAVALVLFLALSVLPARTWYRKLFRENWRAATRLILEESRGHDLISFFDPAVDRPYEYYVSRRERGSETPEKISLVGAGSVSPDLDLIDSLGRRGERIFLVLSHHETDRDGRNLKCRIILERFDSSYTLLRQTQFEGIIVRLYDLRTVMRSSD